ncbi:MAG: DUF4368 domain-containing protein [Fusobacteria bacterium]|nr:DUF4368 domain-containing protein [Fusobacteriota bacterium]
MSEHIFNSHTRLCQTRQVLRKARFCLRKIEAGKSKIPYQVNGKRQQKIRIYYNCIGAIDIPKKSKTA